SNSAVTVNGTLDLKGFSQTLGSLAGNGTVTSSAGTPNTITIGDDNTDTTFSGVIQDGSGTVALVKEGSGALTLSGTNTFSGGVTLNDGTLNINNASALGTGAFTINGGAIDNTSGGITLSTNNNMIWNSGFTFTGSNNLNMGTGTVSIDSPSVTISA